MITKILIFLPTLNEVSNAAELIHELRICFKEADFLVIDDGSIDGTLEELKNLNMQNLTVIDRKNRLGIGSAHLKALQFSKENKYDYLVTLDADGTHRVEDVLQVFSRRDLATVIIGSRFLRESKINDWPLVRIFLTRTAHIFTRIGLGLSYDSSSGLRCYSLKNIPIGFVKYLNDIEAYGYDFFFKSLFILVQNSITIAECPVTLEVRKLGESKMDFLSAARSILLLLREVFLFRILNKKHIFKI